MENGAFLSTLLAVMAGNALTVCFVYCLWRFERHPEDKAAAAGLFGLSLFGLLVLIAVKFL